MRSSERAVQRVQYCPGGGVGRRVPVGHAPPELTRPGVTEHGQQSRPPIRWQRVEPDEVEAPYGAQPPERVQHSPPHCQRVARRRPAGSALAAPG